MSEENQKKDTSKFLWIGIPILIIGVVCSYFIFKEIIIIKDSSSVFYIYSTGAQTIAALVGFVLAAYTFNHQVLSSQKIDDEDTATTLVIRKAIRTNYINIVILSIFTGLTLISDLLVLQYNGVDQTFMKQTTYIIVGSLNITLIIAAFIIALYTIRPIDTEGLAQKLAKEKAEKLNQKDEESKDNSPYEETTVDLSDFTKQFIPLETLVRKHLISHKEYDYNMPMSRMVKQLFERGDINVKAYELLREITRYRNLVVHGHVSEVDKRMYIRLTDMYKYLDRTLESPKDDE